ncbi:MAG: rRNA maturation RNase YbeY [Patescibacteria group bacterium]|jgi:probable rRNA maturation factor
MTNIIDIYHFNSETTEPTDLEIKELVSSCLEKFGVNNYFVEINFVDTAHIHDLNQKYRNIDKPTDVLSFPQFNPVKPKLNFLGSIVICAKIVEEKEESIPDVVKHGLIHLLGYDHEEDAQLWDQKAKIIDCNL